MPSANGPCRFGQYNRFHRLLLDELGYKDVPIYAPDQDQTFYTELGMLDGDFSKLAWWGIVAIDLLDKRLRETRPYEKNKGESDRVYWECLRNICAQIEKREIPERGIREAKEAFRAIPVDRTREKVLIGIVGEIYVRSNTFSNEHLVRKVENLGGQVLIPPIAEWIYYVNYTSIKRNFANKDFSDWLKTLIKDKFQRHYEHRFLNIFDGDLSFAHEPDVKEVLSIATPYIHPSFEGEAILSVGKTLDFVKKGVCGIINAMPFGCMPGTVVNAVLKRVKEEMGNIPYLNMVYEGLEDTNSITRLEAFIHQAKAFKMER